MDKSVSSRALELRNRILEMGFPCAVSFPPFAADHLRPVLCILTFQDALGIIRHSPFDDVPALACGEGYVNSLYHAELFPSTEAMLQKMEHYIFEYLHTEKKLYFGIPGYILPSGFSINRFQIYYRMFSLELTEREKRILRLILYTPDIPQSYRRIEAYCFPYPYHENPYDAVNTIAAQVSTINRKAVKNAGKKILRYQGTGKDNGYILHVRKPNAKKK